MAKILVIEDDPTVRENLEELLRMKGYSAVSSSHGKHGVEMAKREEPDLIISDIMMPEMDGYELLRTVRETPALANTPVVLLTALTMTESKIKGLKYGADDYVTKPFNTDELLARISNLIELRRRLKAKAYLEISKLKVVSADDAFMRELIALFSENLDKSSFSVLNVVEQMGLSKSTIQRRVKSITSKTFNQFLREFRLEQAKQIIEQRGGNISQIAFATGFSSISYFSHSFKKYFGFSPTDIM